MIDFFKKNIETTMGAFLLICLAILILFLAIPIDESSEVMDLPVDFDGENVFVDISKEGVHENASPDESCRFGLEDKTKREVLVSTFSGQSVDLFSGRTWVSDDKIFSLFPNLQSKIDVSCLYLEERGLELFNIRKLEDGVWLDEGSICISMADSCGIPKQ